MQPGRVGRQARAASGVGGEEIAQVRVPDLLVMGCEGPVGGLLTQMDRRCGCHDSPVGSTPVR